MCNIVLECLYSNSCMTSSISFSTSVDSRNCKTMNYIVYSFIYINTIWHSSHIMNAPNVASSWLSLISILITWASVDCLTGLFWKSRIHNHKFLLAYRDVQINATAHLPLRCRIFSPRLWLSDQIRPDIPEIFPASLSFADSCPTSVEFHFACN